jgi:hypothetical protein
MGDYESHRGTPLRHVGHSSLMAGAFFASFAIIDTLQGAVFQRYGGCEVSSPVLGGFSPPSSSRWAGSTSP